MSKPAICQEAIQWGLKQFNPREFLALFSMIPSLKNVLTRGGFTLNEKNYRQENTVKRLVSTLYRRQDLAQSVLEVLARSHREAERMPGGSLDSPEACKIMEEDWREKFAEMPDARLVGIAFYHDAVHPVLSRLGDLLMQTPTFWKTGKVETSEKKREQKKCVEVLEKLIPKKAEQAQKKTVPVLTQPTLPGLLDLSDKESAQPFLPGLLPLTKSAPVPEAKSVEEKAAVSTNVETEKAVPEKPLEKASVEASSEAPVVLSQASVADAAAPTSREMQKLREELTRARKRNEELSNENGKLRKESRIARETMEKTLRQKSEELETIRKEYQEVREDFNDAIDDLRDEFAKNQREQMASFYAEALGIHPDQLTSLYESQANAQSLHARVEKTLAKQRELDKKQGTVQRLRHVENELDQMLTRVRGALEDALVVAPGLVDLEKELEQRLEDVRKQLRKGAEDGENALVGILPRIVGYVKELPLQEDSSLERLTEVEAFLTSPLGRGLFAPDEVQAIGKAVSERRKFVEKGVQTGIDFGAILAENEVSQELRMMPIHRIGSQLDQLRNTEVVIDGYNVIKTDPIMSAKEKAANGFQVVRADFIERCKKKAKFFKKVTLVFDSDLPTDNVIHATENFTVVYAAKKTEDQNADNWIVQWFVNLEAKEVEGTAYQRWVVTNDNGLLARVGELCDGAVDNTTFLAFLG